MRKSTSEHQCYQTLSGHLCEDAQSALRALLPNQVQLVLVVVVDSQFSHRVGGLGDDLLVLLLMTDAYSMSEELLLEILGDPFFDDDIFGVVLRSVSIL